MTPRSRAEIAKSIIKEIERTEGGEYDHSNLRPFLLKALKAEYQRGLNENAAPFIHAAFKEGYEKAKDDFNVHE